MVEREEAMTLPLHVEDSGSGTPVVLLHSSGLSNRQWRRLASALVAVRATAPSPWT